MNYWCFIAILETFNCPQMNEQYWRELLLFDSNTWNHLTVWEQMSPGLFKCYQQTKSFQIIYEDHKISFLTFFVWALLLIVHTWNSSPLRSKRLRLQCICCKVPTTSGKPHGSPLVWACQWLSSQPLLSPQLSHNDSLWA